MDNNQSPVAPLTVDPALVGRTFTHRGSTLTIHSVFSEREYYLTSPISVGGWIATPEQIKVALTDAEWSALTEGVTA